MSPEHCRQERCDERSDIYALGATYYALLAGVPPYADSLPVNLMFQHCAAPVPDLRRIIPAIPNACVEIVGKAMAKRRADRYDNAPELRRALLAALVGG
jgi:serine/threonine protein kinase